MPGEWFGLVVPVGDPGADRGDEVADVAVAAAFDPFGLSSANQRSTRLSQEL